MSVTAQDNKILIVGFTPKAVTPFVSLYEEVFDAAGIRYDEVFFEREPGGAFTAEQAEHGIVYRYFADMDKGTLGRFWTGWGYMRRVRRLIRERGYQKLILLTTESAAYLYGLLKGPFSGRYLFDFRDLTFESFAPFRRLVNTIIEHSAVTLFSSPGFAGYFSAGSKGLVTHNIGKPAQLPHAVPEFAQQHPIRIGFVGLVRYPRENQQLITSFAEDQRFELVYHGRSQAGTDLAEYARPSGAANVRIFPAFDNREKERLYQDIDIINSLYGLGELAVRTALPNRLYDAALYRKPILTSKGTQLAELVCAKGLGLAVDPFTEDIHQAVIEYLATFDAERFEQNCQTFLAEVANDMAQVREVILAFYDQPANR
jgi:hypothetical protein